MAEQYANPVHPLVLQYVKNRLKQKPNLSIEDIPSGEASSSSAAAAGPEESYEKKGELVKTTSK